MDDVAGVVIRHGAGHWRERPAQRLLGEEFRHVAHARGEAGGALAPGRVVRQQEPVRLHVSAAAGGVDDHLVDAGLLEGRDGAAG